MADLLLILGDADPRPWRIVLTSSARISEERLPRLVCEVRDGSSEALGEFYDALAGDIFSLVHRIVRSCQDAEDVTHDVFASLPDALRSYEHSSGYGFTRWLRKVAMRLAVARANHIETRREVPLDFASVSAATLDRTIDRLALEQALRRLTPGVRAVFLLKVVEGYSHREISAMLGIRVGASEVRLHRARRELRSILSDVPAGQAGEKS